MPNLLLVKPHKNMPAEIKKPVDGTVIIMYSEDVKPPITGGSLVVPLLANEDLVQVGNRIKSVLDTHDQFNMTPVPLCEEAVIPCALADPSQWAQMLPCVDRSSLRVALPTDLSPNWVGVSSQFVAKTASYSGYGVLFHEVPRCFYKDQVAESLGIQSHVVEDYIVGPQYEISGIAGRPGEVIHWFKPLCQEWEGHKRIIGYTVRDAAHGYVRFEERLQRIGECVVRALGLSLCGFCIELKGRLAIKVIEVNRRLGEEENGDNYYDLMSPGEPPYDVLVRKLLEV